MKEKFILNDIITYQKKDGTYIYYIIVYSTLTQTADKIFISKDDYAYLLTNKDKTDINNFLERYYNNYKKTFAIRFKR